MMEKTISARKLFTPNRLQSYRSALGFMIVDLLPLDKTRSRTTSGPEPNGHDDIASQTSYQRTLYAITGSYFERTEAIAMYRRIRNHRRTLKNKLRRDVGFAVAALDYLENIVSLTKDPVIFVDQQFLQSLVAKSSMDSMTKIYNHQTVIAILEKELALSSRQGKQLTLLMADLDDFKHVNDRHGHQHGDRVIETVGQVLRANLRSMDIAGRYGGEEFIVVLPDTSMDAAIEIADRIRMHIKQSFTDSTCTTMSIGLANFPSQATDTQALIKAADQALYLAKRSGKNKIVCYPSESDSRYF
ncbi:GGDEF domain-containing protein [Marinobacter caseinilyticus]|uniref:GGDEF domain-containing protein n=1 Tax=Marinobacter caseinilyticus TaxID=2692195 RepID=UPI0014078EFC|nr:GGDEF domain-containing protein [Marinobacter caseinilyticus]